MKKYFTAFVTLLILIAASTNAQVNFNNQVIVYFKSGIQRNAPSNTTATISSANILNVLSTYSIPTSNVIPSFPAFVEADTVITGSPKFTGGLTGVDSRQMNLAKVFTVTITNAATKQNFINSLNAMPEVLYAETNGNISNNIIPADGRFNQQWGMRNTLVPNADIHAVAAWDIFTGNPNAIIAVMDNGVDRVHNDLNAKILGGDNGFRILIDGFGRQFSHGSHVAGIAGAISNNAANNGVAGVDWAARIHPKNIFDGTGDPDITQSIIDAVNFSANVWTFNNSWGLSNGNDEFGNPIPGRYSVTVRSAFAQGYRNNRVQCVAMGNFQVNSGGRYANVVSFPVGFNSGIIAVGATDDHDNIGVFSANGPHIDVSAPGVGIWSTNFNNGYIDISGTSMATPHVAGLASLLKGFNINLANDDIEQVIRLTADDVNSAAFPGFDVQMGTGRINAQRALQTLQAPNTLQQLNATGGTIFSTTASIARVFLGFPGLPDAAYVVKRSEVRKAITLPAMCSTIGVWGRGVGTTGYREENGRSFGEGICEVVPGTLTAAGCTLRTWIYEVWSVNGQYLGFYPRSANNVVFQYTILGVPAPNTINGDNVVCTTSNNYTVNNFRPGATIVWQVTPSGLATPNSPTLPQTTLTKNSNGVITLTATVTNACGTGGQIAITKPNISVGTPFVGGTFTNTFDGSSHPLGLYPAVTNPACTGYIINTNMQILGASAVTWTKISSTGVVNYTQNGNDISFYLFADNQNVLFKLDAVNVCGTTTNQFKWLSSNCGGGCLQFTVSPNPATNSLNVIVPNIPPPCGGVTAADSKTAAAQRNITQIRLYDNIGNLKKVQTENKTKQASINLTGLNTGVYIVEITDGNYNERQQIIIQQ